MTTEELETKLKEDFPSLHIVVTWYLDDRSEWVTGQEYAAYQVAVSSHNRGCQIRGLPVSTAYDIFRAHVQKWYDENKDKFQVIPFDIVAN